MKQCKPRLAISILSILLPLTVIVATAIGTVFVPLDRIIPIMFSHIPGADAWSNSAQDSIIFFVRLPRVLVAGLAGLALAVSGAVMQGVYRNPMADPGIVGVSSGASFGAVVAIKTGLAVLGMWYMPLFAAIGALLASFTIYILAMRDGRVPVLTLILAGMAVSTFVGALTSFVLSLSSDYQIRDFIFWSIGGFDGRQWEHVGLAIVPTIGGSLLLMLFARDLNILQLGEEDAQSLGLRPARLRRLLLIVVSITTAAAVCVGGSIAFVGLVVPHMLRFVVGPDHRVLLPASALGGASFLIICDLIARTAIAPSEIGVGIVTALVGAPYFLWLLLRSRNGNGTWT